MNKYYNSMKKLCTPAFVYFVLSIFSIILIAFQNLGNNSKYCVGLYECNVTSTFLIFIIKLLYVLFWTFLLNILCKSGFTDLSWVLVLLPFVLFFILIGLFLLNSGVKRIK